MRSAPLIPALLLWVGIGACGMRGDPDPFAGAGQVIPTEYVADRFAALPVTEQGDTLRFYTDTGGGLFVLAGVARENGLEPDSAGLVRPQWRPDASVPPPLGRPAVDGGMLVLDEEPNGFGWDGMLGQAWFADRVWVFDYPAQRLILLPGPEAIPAHEPEHVVPLGFLTDSAGARSLSFPRIRLAVDGDSLDLLFDTGAMVRLTESALATFADDGPAERATSFITKEIVDRWVSRHPDWLVIEDADMTVRGMRMIRVPEISVAGHTVGPVWFTERPNGNFHEYMSQWMDRRVDGALGGSALRYFRIVVDYPGARAMFEMASSVGTRASGSE